MSDPKSRSLIQIEWFNVTYRSVLLWLLVGVAALAAGSYWYVNYAAGPKNEASVAITRAATALSKAESLDGDERINEILANARVALGKARGHFEVGRYDAARIAAISSENLSQQAINLARGDETVPKLVRFYRLEGDVRVKRGGEFAWEPANSRMTLNVGDQVKTSSSASAQLIYFDGTVTTIEPGSLLEIRDLFEDPLTKVRRVREKLNWGELLASTQKRNVEGSYHEVETDRASARSQDEGAFRVVYDKERKSGAFDVFQGRIEVATPEKRTSVVAGERVRSTSRGLTAKEILPGVPRLISPSDQKVFVHEDPSKIAMRLSWEPMPGASRYHLEISDKMLFADLLYDAERKDSEVRIEGVRPGDYYWRVAAITRGGVEGPFSEPRRFRVSSEKIRDREDTTPPELKITGFAPVGPMLIINGVTEPGASLWIDSERVDVSEDGSFYSVVRLRKEGLNKIRLVAQDSAGNEATLIRPTYFESY